MTALVVLMMALFAGGLILMIATSGMRRHPGRRAATGGSDGASFPVYLDGGSSDCSAADAGGCGGDGGGGSGGD
jgi:hypothetical protein